MSVACRLDRRRGGALLTLGVWLLAATPLLASDRAETPRAEAPGAPVAVPTARPLAPAWPVPGTLEATALDASSLLPGGSVPWTTLAAPPAFGGGGLLLQGGGPAPQLRYYAVDALGSVRVVFDATGAVVSRADYEPFGAAVPASTTGTLPRQQYTGHERDGEVGVDYFGARMYTPTLGRMPSVDPLYVGAVAEPQRWNRYSYALNNPVMMVDPDGRTTTCSGPTTTPGSELGACSDGGAVQRPTDGSSWSGFGPIFGNFGVSSFTPYDYHATMYGANYQFGPGQSVAPHRRSADGNQDAAKDASKADDDRTNTTQEELPDFLGGAGPTVHGLGYGAVVGFSASTISAAARSAWFQVAGLFSGASAPRVLTYADKAWKNDVFHQFPFSFDAQIVRAGQVQRVSSTYTVYRLTGSVNGTEGMFEIGGRVTGRVLEVTHRHFRPFK